MNRLIRIAAFQNPQFYSAQKMRLSTFGKPRVIGCAEEFPRHIALPRGCLGDLESLLGSHGIALTIQDERHTGEPCEFEFRGELQPEQERAVRDALRFDNGVLVAPTGFGKTVIAARLVADGHHPIIIMQCGPIRVRVRVQDAAKQRSFRQILVMRETDFALPVQPAEPPIQDVYAALAGDPARDALILRDIRTALEDGRCPLVLTERTEHLECLAAELRKHTRHVIVLRGGMGKKQRAGAYEQIESVPAHEARAILATGRYAGEGFDDECLDTLFLVMPISWRGTLQQYVGRLHRACPGKHDVRVYDYVDCHVPVLMRMFSKRLKGYRAMGYTTDGQLELV